MTARRCLAVDVGPTKSGWSVAHRDGPTGKILFIDGGEVPSDLESLTHLIRTWCIHPLIHTTIAIEAPEGHIHEQARGAMIVATSRVAGNVEAIAYGMAIPRVLLPAQRWRRSLCRGTNGIAGDAAVKAILRVLVRDLPAKTSTHLRDALGLACVVLLGGVASSETKPGSVLPKAWQPARREQ